MSPKDGRDRLLFEAIYRYGPRRKEAVLIRRENVGERIWITRLKGGISGEYPIHPTKRRLLLWEYFEQLGQWSFPYLFGTRQSHGGPMSASTIYQLFRRYPEARNCRGTAGIHTSSAIR